MIALRHYKIPEWINSSIKNKKLVNTPTIEDTVSIQSPNLESTSNHLQEPSNITLFTSLVLAAGSILGIVSISTCRSKKKHEFLNPEIKLNSKASPPIARATINRAPIPKIFKAQGDIDSIHTNLIDIIKSSNECRQLFADFLNNNQLTDCDKWDLIKRYVKQETTICKYKELTNVHEIINFIEVSRKKFIEMALAEIQFTNDLLHLLYQRSPKKAEELEKTLSQINEESEILKVQLMNQHIITWIKNNQNLVKEIRDLIFSTPIEAIPSYLDFFPNLEKIIIHFESQINNSLTFFPEFIHRKYLIEKFERRVTLTKRNILTPALFINSIENLEKVSLDITEEIGGFLSAEDRNNLRIANEYTPILTELSDERAAFKLITKLKESRECYIVFDSILKSEGITNALRWQSVQKEIKNEMKFFGYAEIADSQDLSVESIIDFVEGDRKIYFEYWGKIRANQELIENLDSRFQNNGGIQVLKTFSKEAEEAIKEFESSKKATAKFKKDNAEIIEVITDSFTDIHSNQELLSALKKRFIYIEKELSNINSTIRKLKDKIENVEKNDLNTDSLIEELNISIKYLKEKALNMEALTKTIPELPIDKSKTKIKNKESHSDYITDPLSVPKKELQDIETRFLNVWGKCMLILDFVSGLDSKITKQADIANSLIEKSNKLNNELIAWAINNQDLATQPTRFNIRSSVVPEALSHFPNVSSLHIESEFCYHIPKSLEELTKLTCLKIDSNNESFPDISHLQNLQELHIRNLQLKFIPRSVVDLSNLEKLYIHCPEIQMLPGYIEKLKNLKNLKIFNSKITFISDNIGKLENLEELIFSLSSKLRIRHLPESIANLKKLKTLDISRIPGVKFEDDDLDLFPIFITQLPNLEKLDLCAHRLDKVPSEIKNLNKLNFIDLSDNLISYIPSELYELDLTHLYLSSNQFTEIPKEIGQLTNLQVLYLSSNQITEIPKEIGQLTNLQEFLLWGNQLSTLPKEIGRLTNLQELSIQRNQLSTLPEELAGLRKLKYIRTGDNPIRDIPFFLLSKNINLSYNFRNLSSTQKTKVITANIFSYSLDFSVFTFKLSKTVIKILAGGITNRVINSINHVFNRLNIIYNRIRN